MIVAIWKLRGSPPTSSGAIQTAFLPCQRPAITSSAKQTDAGSQTANAGHRRAHNKMARIIWALLVKQESYIAPIAAKA
jgi:hypothetical protein